MSAGAPWVEAVSADELARHESALEALEARAAEPNAFGRSAFLMPALRLLAPRGTVTLLVWRNEARGALIGIAALRTPAVGVGLARVWLCEQAGLASMSLDRDAAGPALDALLGWLRAARPGVVGLILPRLTTSGPLAKAVRALATRQTLGLQTLDSRRRAVLEVGGGAGFEASIDKKRRKEWARQGRRLAERGRLETRVSEDAEGVERFLALEARGWKGGQGTALGADPARLAFAREMLGGFGALGAVAFDELALDGAPIAMAVTLRSGDGAFYWKTAYDERFAEFSPGVQLTLALSRRLERMPRLAFVDSCAVQDHPMIDRLWPGRIELVDLALATRSLGSAPFAVALAAERIRLAMREQAKRAVNRWRGRKRS